MTGAAPVPFDERLVIASDRIWFNSDERLYAHMTDLDRTAWWVVPAAMGIPFYECRYGFTGVRGLDRPCDHCEEWFRSGDGTVHSLGKRDPACGGTGRHTFRIEVDAPFLRVLDAPRGRCLLRASIAEGMVCRIIDESGLMDGTDPVVLLDPWGQAHLLDGENADMITLPRSARPGMWAVLLNFDEVS